MKCKLVQALLHKYSLMKQKMLLRQSTQKSYLVPMYKNILLHFRYLSLLAQIPEAWHKLLIKKQWLFPATMSSTFFIDNFFLPHYIFIYKSVWELINIIFKESWFLPCLLKISTSHPSHNHHHLTKLQRLFHEQLLKLWTCYEYQIGNFCCTATWHQRENSTIYAVLGAIHISRELWQELILWTVIMSDWLKLGH